MGDDRPQRRSSGDWWGLMPNGGGRSSRDSMQMGSTGGGVDTTLKVLTWPELVHDINRVAPFVDEIHIFSLEGAIQQRFLTQLAQLEISSAGEINQREVKNVEALRGKVIMVSKALSHPNWLLFGFAMVGILIIIGSALLAMFIFRKIFRRK